MSKHTNGPWYAEGKYVGSAGGSICDCFGTEKSKEAQANAQLIAAAPAMLEALQSIKSLRPNGVQASEYALQVEGVAMKAIAMAKGGAAC